LADAAAGSANAPITQAAASDPPMIPLLLIDPPA
jgi:hypothetical protein